MKKKSNRGTKTSKFGMSKRENHDSSLFYSSNLYKKTKTKKKIEYVENPLDEKTINKIFCKSSEKMNELPNNSIHLMVTSPPYNVSKEYDEDLTLDEYRKMLKTVFKETHRVLVTGGRACINIANVGRKPYIPFHSYIIQDMNDIGFLMRGEIIWDKSASAGSSCAWGSWKSASNPTLRDVHEYILIFSKETYSRKKEGKINTITRDEFLEYTKSIWRFPTESARRIGHPAPFPVELPHRLIQFYTFENDVILDPFIGSGTTAIAALKTGRNFVGYDTKNEFCELANNRINEEMLKIQAEKQQIKLEQF